MSLGDLGRRRLSHHVRRRRRHQLAWLYAGLAIPRLDHARSRLAQLEEARRRARAWRHCLMDQQRLAVAEKGPRSRRPKAVGGLAREYEEGEAAAARGILGVGLLSAESSGAATACGDGEERHRGDGGAAGRGVRDHVARLHAEPAQVAAAAVWDEGEQAPWSRPEPPRECTASGLAASSARARRRGGAAHHELLLGAHPDLRRRGDGRQLAAPRDERRPRRPRASGRPRPRAGAARADGAGTPPTARSAPAQHRSEQRRRRPNLTRRANERRVDVQEALAVGVRLQLAGQRVARVVVQTRCRPPWKERRRPGAAQWVGDADTNRRWPWRPRCGRGPGAPRAVGGAAAKNGEPKAARRRPSGATTAVGGLQPGRVRPS